ncbi:MAG: aminopeptidase P family protein [Chloroflexi bacterium]|nr:aminopeptidase P family protein [Chloroflexota bacterium]
MPIREASIRITHEEHHARCQKLLEHLKTQNLRGIVLFDPDYVLYYSGFAFVPTERPMALVMNAEGERRLFVPRLELEHAQADAAVDGVDHYPEYPDDPHPMEMLKRALKDLGIADPIGADQDGYPWVFGYRGPSLSELTGAEIWLSRPFIEDQMMIKSEAELRLIRESVRWGNLAHQLLQRYTVPGATETEVSQQASDEAHLAMLDAIGPLYRSNDPFSSGAHAIYRGQIGRNAAIPHALAANITFQSGDVLVTGAGAPVWGYNSELERTMIIGEPSDDQKRFFDHMVALQDAALEAITPGSKCSEVDNAVRSYFEKQDLMPYWKHHSGHAIGIRYHEGPFLDSGDHTEMRPGMVFTVEPGLYVPELGGFRHSDTVVVTDDGIDVLTYYPRDLESLTLPL